ncbi:MAG TPA: DUF6152 family protein [Gammaproteobacteria bacterium]|nr:DUF6152 family protein [Gammaproteobacteria bacterium]
MNTKLAALVLIALAPSAGLAHHSSALFDFNKPVTIDGTVVKLDWKNPHVYFTIESRAPDGKLVRQDIQAASLSMIRALGLRRDMVLPGTHVKIGGMAQRSGSDRLVWGGSVTFDDGSTYLLETIGPNTHIPKVPEATGLAGKWAPPPASIQAFLQTLQTLPLTAAAGSGRAAMNDPRGPASFCEKGFPVGVTAALLGAFPVLHSVEINDKTVVMRIDADGLSVERVVHLDQTAHPAGLAASALGHSIGHWEGATLVIDTVGFTPSPVSSNVLHTVERLTLAGDKRHLKYEMVLHDPKFWTKAVTLSTVWDYRPDVEPSGATCDPQDARRYLQSTHINDPASDVPSP